MLPPVYGSGPIVANIRGEYYADPDGRKSGAFGRLERMVRRGISAEQRLP